MFFGHIKKTITIPEPIIIDTSIKTYFIISPIGTKIGRSANPEERLKQLKTANPDCKIIHIINHDVEKILHAKFKDYQIAGEWYDSNIINQFISTLALIEFNNVDINSEDYDKACDLKIVLSIGSNNDLVDSKNYKPRLNTRFIVPKNDYLKINDDVFISVEYIKLNKRKIQKFINELSTSTIDKRVYYKFTGNKEVLEISD
jgi:hypothetical protein